MFDGKICKQRAKENLKEMYWYSVLAGFIGLIVGVVYAPNTYTYFSNLAQNFDDFQELETNTGIVPMGAFEVLGNILIFVIIIFLFILIFSLLLSLFLYSPFRIGVFSWFNKAVVNKDKNFGTIVKPFNNYGKVILTEFLKNLFLFLGYLVFFPGIYLFYCYYFTSYIRAENRELSAMEVLSVSKNMVNGHKMDLFVFELSFIGWNILNGFTMGLLGIFYVYPYYLFAKTHAYEIIKADAIQNGRVSADIFIQNTVLLEKTGF